MLKLATETMYRLVDFAVAKGLISPIDRPYCLMLFRSAFK